MNTLIPEPPTRSELTTRQRQVWSSGDYSVIGSSLHSVSEQLVDAADLHAGWRVLDVATGSGNAAIAAARLGAEAVGIDYVPELLDRGRERAAAERLPVSLAEADAQSLPFADGEFDAVTSVFGVMFAADQVRAADELVRVVRPGGTIAGLEFAIPHGVWRPAWELYVRAVLPVAGRVISPGWHAVGSFLGTSIRDFYAHWPEAKLLELWRAAGIADVRSQRLSLGGGIVTWGHRT